MTRLWAVGMLAGAVVLGACGGGSSGSTSASGHDHSGSMDQMASCEPDGTTVAISAVDIKFDKKCAAVPAGQAFTIKFDNKEDVAHNLAILGEGDKTLFATEVFNGPKVVDLKAGPLDAGTYAFHCVVHPQMHGTFIVK